MADQTDFLDLYQKLELHPDCGLLEFKRAYRRYVAQLHPDRLAASQCDSNGDGAARLQQLMSQYAAAMDFQRRHGRLPGASGSRASAVKPVHQPRYVETWPAVMPRRSHTRLLAVLVIIIIGGVLWSVGPTPSEAPEEAPGDSIPAEYGLGIAGLPLVVPLALGDTTESVRTSEGTPLVVRADRWEYGPSWIRFQQDQVVDWYSSPLQPLKTAPSRSPDLSP
ncbi:MAG: J domain-containing protein [Dyella sp.]